MNFPKSRVRWSKTYRMVMAHHPPIDIYDDLASPHDWELLTQSVQRSNPRWAAGIGDPSLVPPDRILTGDGASWVMGAFTHASTDRPSRFTDGSFGVYYAGKDLETALREHSYHLGRFFKNTKEASGWKSEVRELVGSIDAELTDVRGDGTETLLDPLPENYGPAQRFAASLRDQGSDGIVYPSLRHEDGECIAAFWPDVVMPPKQGDHYRYHWNGSAIDYVRKITGNREIYQLS